MKTEPDLSQVMILDLLNSWKTGVMSEKHGSVHFPSKRNGQRIPQPCVLKEVLRGQTGADWWPLIGHRPPVPHICSYVDLTHSLHLLCNESHC